jgi:hypothetical protein
MSILFVDRSIHALMFILIVLISINVFKVEDVLLLIIESIELLISCIHFIFVIFRRSYDCRRFMTFIMRRFFCVVSSFIRQSYNDFESIQSIKDTKRSRIANNVALKAASRLDWPQDWISDMSDSPTRSNPRVGQKILSDGSGRVLAIVRRPNPTREIVRNLRLDKIR